MEVWQGEKGLLEKWATPKRVADYRQNFCEIDSQSDLDAFVERIFMEGVEEGLTKAQSMI